MTRQRTDPEERVAELLRTARGALGLSLAFLTRMDGTTQTLEVIESSAPMLFRDGMTQPQETTFCQAILDGRLPPVIPDVAASPEAMRLPAARMPRLRSYISVPVLLSDGSMYGTFCAAGFTADSNLTMRDRALMDVLARAASLIIEPELEERAHRDEVEARLLPLLRDGGPAIVYQPIVDLATGLEVGVEALSRFPREWDRPPDVCFAEAHSIGVGDELECLALERAARYLERYDGYVGMNLSPQTILTKTASRLFARLPLERVLLELSEHDQVEDYEELARALSPLRDAGLRLAIDDVGSGFSSLRHIVLTGPDVLKLDRALVDGVSSDPVLTALVYSLVEFAHGCDAKLVAEGIETTEDAAALRSLGVDYGQGWLFGRPAARHDALAA